MKLTRTVAAALFAASAVQPLPIPSNALSSKAAHSGQLAKRSWTDSSGKGLADELDDLEHVLTYGARDAEKTVMKEIHIDKDGKKRGVEGRRGERAYRPNRGRLEAKADALARLADSQPVYYNADDNTLQWDGHGAASGSGSLTNWEIEQRRPAYAQVEMDHRLLQQMQQMNLEGVPADKLQRAFGQLPTYQRPGFGVNQIEYAYGEAHVNKDLGDRPPSHLTEIEQAEPEVEVEVEAPKRKKKGLMGKLFKGKGSSSK